MSLEVVSVSDHATLANDVSEDAQILQLRQRHSISRLAGMESTYVGVQLRKLGTPFHSESAKSPLRKQLS